MLTPAARPTQYGESGEKFARESTAPWAGQSGRDDKGARDDHRDNNRRDDNRRDDYRRDGPLKPPLRPGYDDDNRLAKLDDDPRYFRGAELGKAQKAALGVKGLAGMNTASFDPESTLIRPQMRVLYGAAAKKYPAPIKPDDVVIAPDFCDSKLFRKVAEELAGGSPGDLVLELVHQVQRYLKLDDAAYTVSWSHAGKSCEARGRDNERAESGANVKALLVLGADREVAFQRTTTPELLYLHQPGGSLSAVARDAQKAWNQAPRPAPGDHVLLEIRGRSAAFVEETVLRAPEGPKAGEESGTVRKWDDERGFGFIAPADGGEEVFVHHSSLAGARPQNGDRVTFDKVYDDRKRKYRAENVSSPSAGSSAPAPVFDVAKLPPRPSLRVIAVPPTPKFQGTVRHDDVIIVPEFFCKEDDWGIYYQLIKEMRESQAQHTSKAEWIPWHEGAHLLSQNPTGSRTFHDIIDRCAKYFSVPEGNRGTRFNWYRDGSDWKPFHHDSAAFNPQRARNQNCTVGISFGHTRELAFRHAKTGEVIYFPQTNGGLFFFGRDANIIWQHGINALPVGEQDGKGRISIVLWGWCSAAVDEEGSPEMLNNDERKGKGKGKGDGKGKGKGKYGFSMHGR